MLIVFSLLFQITRDNTVFGVFFYCLCFSMLCGFFLTYFVVFTSVVLRSLPQSVILSSAYEFSYLLGIIRRCFMKTFRVPLLFDPKSIFVNKKNVFIPIHMFLIGKLAKCRFIQTFYHILSIANKFDGTIGLHTFKMSFIFILSI